jgi:hypothetical protein
LSFTLDSFSSRRDSVAIPTLWLALALSLLLHALLLLGWLPKVMTSPIEDLREGKQSGALAVRLAPPPTPPPGAVPSPPPLPTVQARPERANKLSVPKAAPKPPAAPHVLALERPSPSKPTAPPPAEAERLSAKGDLSSYVEARRGARDPAPAAAPAPPPGETEQERTNRLAAERLGLTRAPAFGSEKNRGGGIFQIQRVGYDDAEFFFYGWNKAIRRNARQMITVTRGNNPTIELAVVRKMIAIIREYAREDFTWESQRLHRDVQLSARLSDNAGLEDFMMQEFFAHVRK